MKKTVYIGYIHRDKICRFPIIARLENEKRSTRYVSKMFHAVELGRSDIGDWILYCMNSKTDVMNWLRGASAMLDFMKRNLPKE